MNRERFTLKANQAIERSVKYAEEFGNQEITTWHLLNSLLLDSENIVVETIKKVGVDISKIISSIEEEIKQLPKVQGAESYPSKNFSAVLNIPMIVILLI